MHLYYIYIYIYRERERENYIYICCGPHSLAKLFLIISSASAGRSSQRRKGMQLTMPGKNTQAVQLRYECPWLQQMRRHPVRHVHLSGGGIPRWQWFANAFDPKYTRDKYITLPCISLTFDTTQSNKTTRRCASQEYSRSSLFLTSPRVTPETHGHDMQLSTPEKEVRLPVDPANRTPFPVRRDAAVHELDWTDISTITVCTRQYTWCSTFLTRGI